MGRDGKNSLIEKPEPENDILRECIELRRLPSASSANGEKLPLVDWLRTNTGKRS